LETLKKKESKVLHRVELEVVIPAKSGSLSRTEAAKMVAAEMKVDESQVGVLSLSPESGTTKLKGTFHVYSDPQVMGRVHEKHFSVRLKSKEEREALKQAKKKSTKPEAK
jgi:ribosomal protein S24E